MAETRVDPYDGKEYTYKDMLDFYKDSWKKAAVKAYWDTCVPRKAAAKLKAKEKPKAKAKSSGSSDNPIPGNAWDMLGGFNEDFAHALPEGHTGQFEVVGARQIDKNEVPRWDIAIKLDDKWVVRVSPAASFEDGRFYKDREALRPYVVIKDKEQWEGDQEREKKRSLDERIMKAVSISDNGDDSAELLLQKHENNFNRAFQTAVDLGAIPAMGALLQRAPDGQKTTMLMTRYMCYTEPPLLVRAARDGKVEVVEELLALAKSLGEEVLKEILCQELLTAHERFARPEKGHHALSQTKNLLLHAAESCGGQEFKDELLKGRPQWLDDREKREVEEQAQRTENINKAKAVGKDTPAQEAAEALLADPFSNKKPGRAVRCALDVGNYAAAKLVIKKSGEGVFLDGLLFEVTKSVRYGLDGTKTILEAASEVGGDALLKKILMEKKSLKEGYPATAPVGVVCFPEVRELHLEAAKKLGILKELEACPVLEPRSLGDQVLLEKLPHSLKVSGAGTEGCNGEYKLMVNKDGGVKWKGNETHPV